MGHDDFDLLARLFRVLTPRQEFVKIRAHLNPHEIADDLTLYQVLGNMLAEGFKSVVCTIYA